MLHQHTRVPRSRHGRGGFWTPPGAQRPGRGHGDARGPPWGRVSPRPSTGRQPSGGGAPWLAERSALTGHTVCSAHSLGRTGKACRRARGTLLTPSSGVGGATAWDARKSTHSQGFTASTREPRIPTRTRSGRPGNESRPRDKLSGHHRHAGATTRLRNTSQARIPTAATETQPAGRHRGEDKRAPNRGHPDGIRRRSAAVTESGSGNGGWSRGQWAACRGTLRRPTHPAASLPAQQPPDAPGRAPTCQTRPETYLWTPSTRATSSGEDEMYTQDFPPSGDFRGPSTSSSSFTWMVWHRHRARKNSSSRSCESTAQPHRSTPRRLRGHRHCAEDGTTGDTCHGWGAGASLPSGAYGRRGSVASRRPPARRSEGGERTGSRSGKVRAPGQGQGR